MKQDILETATLLLILFTSNFIFNSQELQEVAKNAEQSG
jgi:hypothetical protein